MTSVVPESVQKGELQNERGALCVCRSDVLDGKPSLVRSIPARACSLTFRGLATVFMCSVAVSGCGIRLMKYDEGWL